jgi:hypothetical protein
MAAEDPRATPCRQMEIHNGERELNKKIGLDSQSGDEATSRRAAVDPKDRKSAAERKRTASGSASATTRGTRKTGGRASTPKRRKPFVL